MSVTAFAAGHLVGGAVWQVLTPDEEQVIYAVHWNHRKDRHLKRADLDGRFSRPAVLITDACSAEAPPLDVSRGDSEFLGAITSTLAADGAPLLRVEQVATGLQCPRNGKSLGSRHWGQRKGRYVSSGRTNWSQIPFQPGRTGPNQQRLWWVQATY